MAIYSFKAKNDKGEVVENVIQASKKSEALALIKSENLQVLTLKSLDEGVGNVYIGGVSTAEKATFCRFVATMLRAGLTLPEALDIIKDETKNKKFKNAIIDMTFSVRRGSNLSSVMSKHKDIFDPIFLTIIKAGEESGTLDQSFDQLSKQLLSSHELSQKIKGALMYPAVIVVAMMANFAIMIVFVLPKLSEVFDQLNAEIPWYTRVVLDFGNFIGANTFLVLGILMLAGFMFFMTLYLKKSRDFVMDNILKLPGVRNVVNQLDIARFANTLSILMRSGVPIMVALEVSTDVIRQQKTKLYSKDLVKGVESGKTLSEVLLESDKKIFPGTVTQTIKAGEKTGTLEVVLGELSEFYEKEVDYSLKRLTSLLEPVLMLVIGVVVGLMVIMMITPIYNLVGGLDSNF
jgi:type IV pilus assembly protein PilC